MNTGAAYFWGKWKEHESMKLTKYEKETIILTSEGDDTYNVYTFNAGLKRRLADFASIRLTAPYSEERKKAARDQAVEHGFKHK